MEDSKKSTPTLADKISELEMRIIALESDMRILREKNMFNYCYDSATNTWRYKND